MLASLDGILLIIHIFFGTAALLSGPVAIFTKKANRWHRGAGKIFALSMTFVFVTAVVLAAMHNIPFLFMISFLSYYSVFAGVRIIFLKQLHKGQRPRWYDWLAGVITILAGMLFVAYGSFVWIQHGFQALVVLSLIFGGFTALLGYNNLRPFWKRPEHPLHWWFYHMGNMLGGYAAALTAFLVTMAGRMEIHSPVVWLAPLVLLLIASPFLRRHYKRKFGLVGQKI